MFIKLLILAIIVYIKAIFSAVDTAYTYLNKHKINQMSKRINKSDKKTKKIKEMLDHKLRVYGTTRIGITLAELFASVFTAEAFLDLIAKKMEIIGISDVYAQYTFSVIIITIVLSYFTLVFGELLPKRIARNNPEKVAYKTIDFLLIVSKLNYIFEKFLNFSEEFFAKIFGIKNEPEEKLTEKEIKLIISEGKDQGIFDENERKLLYNAFKFDDLRAKDIMIPKENVVSVDVSSNIDEIIEFIKKFKFTRIPVYSKSNDNIIGILNVKDILIDGIDKNSIKSLNLEAILRDPIYATKEEKIENIFRNMQINKKHMAIILNKDGKLEGLVTLENILESLVGNIIDEFESN